MFIYSFIEQHIWGIALMLGFVVFAIIALLALRMLIERNKNIREQSFFVLATLSAIIAVLQIIEFFIHGNLFHQIHDMAMTFFAILWWLSLAFWCDQLIKRYVWDLIFTTDGACIIPAFIRRLVMASVYLLAVTGILAIVFHQQVTAIAALSGGVVVLLGYIAQNVIAEIFAGIALSIAPVFRKGDIIEFDGQELIVEDMNWRFATFVDYDNNRTCVPNSQLLGTKIKNYYLGDKSTVINLTFVADNQMPPQLIIDALEKALDQVTHVIEKPRIFVDTFPEHGVKYTAAIRIKDRILFDDMRTDAYKIIWYTLKQHNIALYEPTNQLSFKPKALPEWYQPIPEAKLQTLFKAVSIFQDFTDDDIKTMIQNAKRHEYVPPQRIITFADTDSTLHIIVQGSVSIIIPQSDGELLKVASLPEGQSVGIMALLTGEKRSAHVVAETYVVTYEIDRDVLKPLIEKSPERIQQIVQRIAAMAAEDRAKTAQHSKEVALTQEELERQAHSLIGKIRNFFSIS